VVVLEINEDNYIYKISKAIFIQTLAEGETLGLPSLAANKRATLDHTRTYHPGNLITLPNSIMKRYAIT
jgi:hypothetical protein